MLPSSLHVLNDNQTCFEFVNFFQSGAIEQTFIKKYSLVSQQVVC